MSVEPKIKTKEQIEILKNCYIEMKMSTVEIENKSKELFGIYISRGTVYKEIIKNGIEIRNKSDSISRAMSSLDIDKSFINNDLIEWIDGLMLGDGYIDFNHVDFKHSRIGVSSSKKEWASYATERLLPYNPSGPKTYNKICERTPNPIWYSVTKTHPDIINQAKRWYSGLNNKKVVPNDIRITPTSAMLWYLGDGSFSTMKHNSSQLRLATCSFSKEEINEILIPKLNEHNIQAYSDNIKNDIHIRSDSTKDFFNFIGWKSPIHCYDYKFNIPEWYRLIRLSEIVKDEKEKWRAQYYYKMGKIKCSKSPGGEMLLFTEEESKDLRKLLDRII